MQELLKKLYPQEEFEILEYNGGRGYIKIECKRCGKIIEYQDAQAAKQKKNLCGCQEFFKTIREKLDYLSQEFHYDILENKELAKIKCKCKICGREWTTNSGALMRGGSCSCQNKFLLTKEQMQGQFDKKFGEKEYTLLDYKTRNSKGKIQHNKCGFIWEQTPGHFLEGCGCPQCYRKRSKGETAIALWLESNNIIYQTQYTITDDKSHLYLDFYLTDYNLGIEYQGEQHYHPVKNFGGKAAFEKQVQRDAKKRETLKEEKIDLLEISYTELKNIPNILSSKLNDYRKHK